MFFGSVLSEFVRARIWWEYEGKTGIYEDALNHGTLFWLEPEATTTGRHELEKFWWTDGNGACDCNRARMFGIGEFPCGKRINILRIEPLLDGKESRAMTESDHG